MYILRLNLYDLYLNYPIVEKYQSGNLAHLFYRNNANLRINTILCPIYSKVKCTLCLNSFYNFNLV